MQCHLIVDHSLTRPVPWTAYKCFPKNQNHSHANKGTACSTDFCFCHFVYGRLNARHSNSLTKRSRLRMSCITVSFCDACANSHEGNRSPANVHIFIQGLLKVHCKLSPQLQSASWLSALTCLHIYYENTRVPDTGDKTIKLRVMLLCMSFIPAWAGHLYEITWSKLQDDNAEIVNNNTTTELFTVVSTSIEVICICVEPVLVISRFAPKWMKSAK